MSEVLGSTLDDVGVCRLSQVVAQVHVTGPRSPRRDATALHLEAESACASCRRATVKPALLSAGLAPSAPRRVANSDTVFTDDTEKFPDGWEANALVLEHTAGFRD